MTWVWVTLVIMTIVILSAFNEISKIKAELKELKEDRETTKRWLLYLLSKGKNDDDKRPEELRPSRERSRRDEGAD